MIRTEGLTKHFGALAATSDLDLHIAEGEIHALIGPNGAGKTTLIGQLSGELTPDRGRILFRGQDITRLSVPRRSHLGMARSFQITNIFLELTVLENVAMAVQAHAGHSFRFWRDARYEQRLVVPAQEALARMGLAGRAHVPAASLAHGEQRQLEIAMALATRPRMLLLDEPMAGMGPEESSQMVEMLRGLRGAVTMLLVEHDMDAVFALADRITVLVYGSAIVTDTPAAVRASTAVREAYLGDESADTRPTI